MSSLARTFSTLRLRDFRLYWLALVVSLLGSSFQTAAQDWLVFRLTNSALILGVAAFIPAVLAAPFSLVGGALADRLPRRRLILFTQTGMIVPPLVLAWRLAAGRVQVWHVILSSVVMGVIVSVDAPARLALLNDLVSEDDLGNAMGLSTAVYQGARVVGPALAGVLIGLGSEALPFVINGLSYGAMVVALLMIETPSIPAARTRKSLGRSVVDGYRFVLAEPALFGLMGLLFLQGVLLMPYLRLMPAFAKDALGAGPETYGLLLASTGVGALLGGLLVAATPRGRRGLILTLGILAAPLVLIAFAWSRSLPVAVVTLLFMGAGTASLNTLNATLLQLNAPNEMRGRVMSIASIGYLGSTAFGALPLGFIAQRSSASIGLTVGAVLCLVLAAAFTAWFPHIRRLA